MILTDTVIKDIYRNIISNKQTFNWINSKY